MRGRRPASTRPTSTTAVTARTSPARSPGEERHRHHRRRARRDDRQRPRRPGLGLLLPVRDGGGAHLRRRRRARRRQHELLHRPVALQLRVGRRLRLGRRHRRSRSPSRRSSARRSSPRWTTPTIDGVTLVAAAGNELTNLAAPTRSDATSPDYPDGAGRRAGRHQQLPRPARSRRPSVISVSSIGPSRTKADYSNYGLGNIDVAAPGGWFRDDVGTPTFRTPGNLILSCYPLHVAIDEGLADENGAPDRRLLGGQLQRTATTAGSTPTCRAPRWPRRTSPASPPWSSRRTAHGRHGGYSLDPRHRRAHPRATRPSTTPARPAASRSTPTRGVPAVQRDLRGHDRRQRPVRRGHRQRHTSAEPPLVVMP